MFSFWRTLPDRLSRVTSGGKIISEIDGFRFLAIFPVVVNHLAQRIERYATHPFDPPLNDDPYFFWASRGYVGVYVFFVISGFILSMPFASHFIYETKPVKLKDYFVRRLTRLEPPYIIVMTLCLIGGVLTHLGTLAELLPHYGASLLYLHTIIYKMWSPMNPVTWTLEVEVQFYILAPFLAMLFFRIPDKMLRRVVLVGSIIAIVCVQQHFGWMKYPWRFYLLGHLHFFLVGFLLTDLYLCEWKDGNRKPGALFDILSLVGILGIFVMISHDFINRLAYPILLFFIFYGAFRSTQIIRFFRNRWIAAIGGMCYTIYLIHLPLSEAFERVVAKFPVTNSFIVNLLVQLPVFLLLTFAASVVFFLAIEKPCMNKDWPKQLKEKIMQRYRLLKS